MVEHARCALRALLRGGQCHTRVAALIGHASAGEDAEPRDIARRARGAAAVGRADLGV